MATRNTHASLTDTLVLALTQCQDQVRALEERAQTITRLQQENESLRRELESARAATRQDDATSDHRAELERLYQNDFDKQAQIDQLRQKLKIVKIKARQRGLTDAISSSPLPSSSTGRLSTRPTPNTSPPDVHISKTTRPDATPVFDNVPSVLPRKRIRSQSPNTSEPLREVSGNVKSVKKAGTEDTVSAKRRRRSDRIIAAVPAIAEDGEVLSTEEREGRSERKTKETHSSAYERLQDLMSAPTPTRPALLQAATPSISSPKSNKVQEECSKESTSSSDSKLKSSLRSTKRPAPRFLMHRTPSSNAPEDDEPFRSRPLSKLDLSHFKLNPAANDGLQHAYREVVRGRQERKCLPGCTKLECCGSKFSVLAATLPSMPGMQGISDDELLKGYLGIDSEERIRSLTPVARENLLHEARTKLVANLYGKMHRDVHERGRSPPGYWSTDMPGSQEHEDLQQQARLLEREETRRRHQEAMKEGGRWMFADE